MDVFKDIVGYEGRYRISNTGAVLSLNYNRTGQSRVLKLTYTYAGYAYVLLAKDGVNRFSTIHRLVAMAFIPNENNKPQVNHINGIRTDNRVENLEWVTSQENCLHAFRSNGRKHSAKHIAIVTQGFTGANNPKAKLKECEVLSIRRLSSKGIKPRELCERFNISKAQVSAIVNFKCWAS